MQSALYSLNLNLSHRRTSRSISSQTPCCPPALLLTSEGASASCPAWMSRVGGRGDLRIPRQLFTSADPHGSPAISTPPVPFLLPSPERRAGVGSLIVNWVPRPGSLCRVIRPPWASMIFRAVGNPRPEPPRRGD